ncbi:MAG TPA: hypothetical protein VGN42_08435 [Pirellulales bacterium]|nr:hypothetical protein [Pirellulales bacterium]
MRQRAQHADDGGRRPEHQHELEERRNHSQTLSQVDFFVGKSPSRSNAFVGQLFNEDYGGNRRWNGDADKKRFAKPDALQRCDDSARGGCQHEQGLQQP